MTWGNTARNVPHDTQNHLFPARGGFFIDTGYVAFTTTGTTVDIYTSLSEVWGVISLIPATVPTGNERFYIDETVSILTGKMTVPAGGALTLTRVPEYVEFTHSFTDEDFSGNDLEETVLFCSVRALTLSSVKWTNGPNAWDNAILGLGTADGTPVNYMALSAVTGTAYATTTMTTFADDAVAAGAEVAAYTTTGDTGDPYGSNITVQAYVALTSGLGIFYTLFGID